MYSLLFLSTLVFLKITCCATAIFFFLIIIRGCECECECECARACVVCVVMVLGCCARKVGLMGAWVGLWIKA